MIYMTDQYRADAALSAAPLTHSRILWDNVLAAAAFSATSQREGFEAARAQSPDTVSWWWPSAAGTLTAVLAAPAAIDGIGIAAHTLGSAGAAITVSVRVGGDWQTVHDPIAPPDDEALMLAFPLVTADAVRIALSAPARIGVLYAGAMLEMAHQPNLDLPALRLVRSTIFETNRSVTGQIMGRSVVSTSRPFSVTWPFLRRPWVRDRFDPFIRAARENPFFIALRPGRDPEDVGYALTDADIIPTFMGAQNYMTVALTGEAHAEPDA